MLFHHHTQKHSTAFTLVLVDDFLVRYSHPSELDHIVSCLSTFYDLKVRRDLPRYTYLGYTLDYSPTSPSPPCMILSMPNYIPSMLSHLCPSGCGSASSPAVYTQTVSPTDSSLTTPSSTYRHPLYPSLCRREDIDPTSSWVSLCSSMPEPWTYPSSPQSANSPPINLPPLNTTLPLPTAS
jgi:hypothetical protein